MKLGLVLLKNVNSVNSFTEVDQLEVTSGNAFTLYFRLIDEDQPLTESALRHIPASGASVSVLIKNIDESYNIDRTASNPFPEDKSIFSMPILATDEIGSSTIDIKLTEGSNVSKASLKQALAVDSDNDSYC
jgi:hypothetical protein